MPRASAAGSSPGLGGDQTIVAVRVQGNLTIADDEVVRLAGLQVGASLESDTVARATERLRASRRFERVEIRERFASIADPSQIVLVIVVDEGPVHLEKTGDPDQPLRAVRSRGPRVMFLPVLSAEDGYGVTYGARLALPDPAGADSRLSFPMTWGGDKRVGAELEKRLEGRPIGRVIAGVSRSRRTNPHFDRDDDRTRLWIRGERQLGPSLRLGGTAGWQRARFLGADDRFFEAGADLVLDTRLDPVLARNAVYARAAWEHAAGANRGEFEGRGYVGVWGQNIVVLRGLVEQADRPLPAYLEPLLGGMANLRGLAAGTEAGDALVASSAELVVPLTSPLSVGKMGVSGFVDAGAAYDRGERLADQPIREGYGGSLWFAAAFLRLNVAVAHGRGSSTRVHVGAAVTF